MRRARSLASILLSLFLLVLGCGRSTPSPRPEQPSPPDKPVSYSAVQRIFDRRCVVCHSCNDSPCQLDTTAFAGVDRGASADNVYSDRLFSADPSRLFIDAKTTDEWRERGFFPVIRHYPVGDPRNLDDSILYQLIRLRREHELPGMKFNAFSSRSCPNLRARLPRLTTEIRSLFEAEPHADLGMPYGFPGLKKEEFDQIRAWLHSGAPAPAAVPLPAEQAALVDRWEGFLNAPGAKQRLVSRYLYEHLFYAHAYFPAGSGAPDSRPQFYRLVRSRAAPPQPIDEIATRLPYDDPGSAPFSYRLQPVEQTIVHKTHLSFPFSPEMLANWENVVADPAWNIEPAELPRYLSGDAANPFLTFQKIPAKVRYRFMLEHAEYFIASFMKGPVCRGQMALNVIDDHFFIFFLNPEADQSIMRSDFFTRTGKYLITPFRPEDLFARASDRSLWTILELPIRALQQLRQNFYPYYKGRQLKYLKRRDEFYRKARPDGFSLEDLWDGDGKDPNAVLTVFRHHDSASVMKGAWGGLPKTSLVLDYPIFERMYYNLVVSFDIFSDVKLQLATRLYMDDLRIEGEDLFLSFLPLESRVPIRNFWYRNAQSTIWSGDYPLYGTTDGRPRGTRVPYESKNPKAEFIARVLRDRMPEHLGGMHDLLNRGRGAVLPETFAPIRNEIDLRNALSAIGGVQAPFVSLLPDVFYVRIRSDHPDAADLVFTFIRNRGHYNVKYLFGEGSRLLEEEDTISIIEGFHGSYPNFFFDLPFSKAADFLFGLVSLKKEGDSFSAFIDRFGVRRRNPAFWEESDFFNARLASDQPIDAGVLDLSRYENY